MREQTSLVREFDETSQELIDEFADSAMDMFHVPNRNWNGLIDSFNSANKRKFPLSALECRVIIEQVKQSIPAQSILKACGVTKGKFDVLMNLAGECEEKFQELATKDSLNDEDFNTFQTLMRNPIRVLMEDVSRAEGIAEVIDWQKFNENAKFQADVQFAKMKAKFRDFFNEKETRSGGSNVTIVLGGNFIEDL